MGVTRVENAYGIFLLDHELHDVPFTPELGGGKVDAIVLETFNNVPPNDMRQTMRSESISHNQQIDFAQKRGGFLIVDVPAAGYVSWTKLDAMIGEMANKSDMEIAADEAKGVLEMGVGAALTAYGFGRVRKGLRNPTDRRGFLAVAGVGVALGAAAIGLGLPEVMNARSIKSLNRAFDGGDGLIAEQDVAYDDPRRRALADNDILNNSMTSGMRNVVNAIKLNSLAEHMKGNLGRKPTLYLVYGMSHTGIADLLADEGKMEAGARRWQRQIREFLEPEWVDKVTQWRYDDKVEWHWEVRRLKVPQLNPRADESDKKKAPPLERMEPPKPPQKEDPHKRVLAQESRREFLERVSGRGS